MKFLVLAALAVLAVKTDVRFERDGVRIGDVLVQGAVLELKGAGAAALLASGSSVEALASSLEIGLAAERTLTLEPGLRVTRAEGGWRLEAHGSRNIRFAAPGATVTAEGPVIVGLTPEGWLVGETKVAGGTLRAGLQAQDDTESNLDKMLKQKARIVAPGVPKLATRTNRLFWGNPLTPGTAAGSIGVRQVPRVSGDGAP